MNLTRLDSALTAYNMVKLRQSQERMEFHARHGYWPDQNPNGTPKTPTVYTRGARGDSLATIAARVWRICRPW